MKDSLKNKINENIKSRKEYLIDFIKRDIQDILQHLLHDNKSKFTKFVFFGITPWNDGEDEIHRLYWSTGYCTLDGDKVIHDRTLENYHVFKKFFPDLEDYYDIYEYLDDNDQDLSKLENINDTFPYRYVEDEAHYIDKLMRTVKNTNFSMVATLKDDGIFDIELDFDVDVG